MLMIGLAGAAVGLGACSRDMGAPQPMTVVNQTGGRVEVTLVGELDQYEELPMTLEGGGGTGMVVGPFKVRIRACAGA